MALAARLARNPLLTTLLFIGAALAVPTSYDASTATATAAPAPATTADTAALEGSVPGSNNENSAPSKRVVGRDPRRFGGDSAAVRRRHDTPAIFESTTNPKRADRDSRTAVPSVRFGADLNDYAAPYYPPIDVAVVPYVVTPFGYAGAFGTFDVPFGRAAFKQAPPFPFQVQWPLASYFPVLIKDPFLTFLHGGGWNDLVEYGQAADVCTFRQFRSSPRSRRPPRDHDNEEPTLEDRKPASSSRRGRSLAKRAVSQATPLHNSLEEAILRAKKINKIKRKKTKPAVEERPEPSEKNDEATSAQNGDLRFPFGSFDWFGNKKPVAPSPGFFINRLKVHRGGVAIAGPGGVATAGRGGTAIVGPGGLAYTQPGGLAVAGPHSRVLALSADADLDALAERVRERLASGSPVAPDPQAELVATGPVVYYHNETSSSTSTVVYLPYYGGAAGQYLAVTRNPSGAVIDQRIVPADRAHAPAAASPEAIERAVQVLQVLAAETLAGRSRAVRAARLRALAAASGDLLQLLWRSDIDLDPNSVRYSENDVGEEGEDDAVEVETDVPADAPPPAGLVADAKPVGIAVAASGVAAARPVATALTASGLALARPVATAVAGLDPAALGISLNFGHLKDEPGPSPTSVARGA